MSEPIPAEATPPEAQKGFLARVIGVFVSPAETFEDVRRKPTLIVPMLALMALFAVISYLILPAQFADQLERTKQSRTFQNLPPEQQEQQLAFFEEPPSWMVGISVGIAPIAIVAFSAFFALLYWGAGHMLGGDPTYKATLSMILFIAWINPIAHMAAKLPLILSKGTVIGVTYGPAMFMPDLGTTTTLYLGLAALDLFNIWSTVVTGIGLSKIARISTGMGIGIAVVLFAIASGIQLFFAGLSG